MTSTTAQSCPTHAALVEWFDGLLDEQDAARLESHLEDCERCRLELLSWSERGAQTTGGDVGDGCPSPELVIAYAVTASESSPDSAAIEAHLRSCSHCVSLLQQGIAWQRQMGNLDQKPAALKASVRERPAVVAPTAASPAWWSRLLTAWEELFAPRLVPLGALATLLLVFGVLRVLSSGGGDELRQARDVAALPVVELVRETTGHARPDAAEPIVAQLAAGTKAQRVEGNEQWTRLELDDGRRVWVRSDTIGKTER